MEGPRLLKGEPQAQLRAVHGGIEDKAVRGIGRPSRIIDIEIAVLRGDREPLWRTCSCN